MTAIKANDKASGVATNGQSTDTRGDLLKWIVVAAIVVAGVVGGFFLPQLLSLQGPETGMNQGGMYAAVPWVLGIIVVVSALFVASLTTTGKQLLQFFKDAQLEMRKVVWPTRQETLQATLMVLVAVLVMSILLWIIDMVLFRIINFLTT